MMRVSQLRPGDRVRVIYPGWTVKSEGVVFYAGKGYTTARRDDGSIFRIKHTAFIELLKPLAARREP